MTIRYSVLRFVRPYTPVLGGLLTILIASSFLGLLHPWFVQQLIDRVLLDRRPDLLWIFGTALFGVALVRFGASVLQARLFAGVTSRVLLDMRRDFLEHLQALSPRFFAGARFGDVITRFNRDLSQVQEIATSALLGFVTNVLTLIGVLVFGLLYDWRLFLLASIPFPLALAVAQPFRKRVRDLSHKLRELSADLATVVIETITGMRTVRAYGRERGEVARFLGRGHAMVRTILSFQLTRSLASGLPRLCLVLSTVIVYTTGGAKVIRGEMQLGELVALGMYVGMVYGPLTSLVELYLQLIQARVSLERVRELRELPPEVIEDPAAPAPDIVHGAIAFEDVTFRYLEDRPLLEDLSFRIAAGETVALVGASGAGKSTIIDLLLRFLDPSRGRVTIDGRDLRHVRARAIRRRTAVVSQDDHLFHTSLFDNVRFGAPHAARDDVLAACRQAGLDELIAELPDGVETLVGERGLKLSAGQRQRVSIARALLVKPSILVLDEATSSLDYASDRAIRRAVQELMYGATTLIVTHRLTSLLDVDRVLVLDGGRIAEEGSPRELAARGGPYQEMLAIVAQEQD